MNTTSTGAGTDARPAGRDSSPFQCSMPNDLQAALAARALRNHRTVGAEAVALIERGMLVANPLDLPTAGSAVPGRDRTDQLVERASAAQAIVDGALLVDQLLDAAFVGPRSPRSVEYRAGARAALDYRINGVPIRHAYPASSAQDDAFAAGVQEGHAIWRRAVAAGAA